MKSTKLLLALMLSATLSKAADPIEVQDRVNLADGLFRRGMFDLAAREYATLASENGLQGMDAVLFQLGECYRRTNRPEVAEAAYTRIITKFPQSNYASRARMQSALIQLTRGGKDALEKAAVSFEKLTASTMPKDVRAASLYHWGETLEKMGKDAEARAKFEELTKEFGYEEYGMYAALKNAWLLSKTETKENRRAAMGIYLDLSHKATNDKVAEEASFFAAQLAFAEQRYEETSQLFRELRKRWPNSSRVKESALPEAWSNYYSGKWKEALEAIAPVLEDKANPRREEALYIKANSLRQLEERKQALATYAELLKNHPKGKLASRAWFEQLGTFYRDGDYSNVLATVAAKILPPEDKLDSVCWMASSAALELGRDDEAVENARRLVEKCPKSPFAKDALYRLGWLLQKQKAWEAATQWYQQIPSLYPQDPLAPKALYCSGVCFAAANNREAALREWTTLLAKYPNSEEAPEALYQKAMEELRGKDWRAAGTTLDERLRRFPDAPNKADVLYWRGIVYQQNDDGKEAERLLREALANAPSKEIERAAVLELGGILDKQGKREEAADLFQQLVDSPDAAKLDNARLANLAEFQLKNGRLEAALSAAKKLSELAQDPGWKQTGCALQGFVHQKKNERDAAIAAFREALKTGANTIYGAEAALNLGRLLTESGQFEEAGTVLEEAAARAVSPEMIRIRAQSYAALAKNSELKKDIESALRYYISVGILFDDPQIVPLAMDGAARMLDLLGRPADARSQRDELKQRYPDWKPATEAKQ